PGVSAAAQLTPAPRSAGARGDGGLLGVMGIQQRIPEDLGWVRHLRSRVLEFVDDECGNAAEIRADVALAVTEACSNVARHAYPSGGGTIRVAARTEHGELVVVVSDEGVGLGETSSNPGGGFGLRLI